MKIFISQSAIDHENALIDALLQALDSEAHSHDAESGLGLSYPPNVEGLRVIVRTWIENLHRAQGGVKD